ncbi:MAG: UDP-N-acetylmuramoyl-L-alanyl-D-glutamate--2,6-diaminopimelate ligase [Candidatus Gastranaerophilales bacterium]|nr:UDP-N-acetylmuramoyl-L-alanyl-D-glutamate--2,6-diaminopimelate ligase [Candidatus Gastranaerophilales bacterium]
MELSKLVENINIKEKINFEPTLYVKGISYNSKTVKSGDIFVCLRGEHVDGHNFAADAVQAGAVAVMCETGLELDVPQVIVASTEQSIAPLADNFYNSPSKDINLIGVTGTNGKTTVTHLIQRIIESSSEKCALIGTLGYKLSSDGEYKEAKHTTPQAPELQKTLTLIKDEAKIKYVSMEVSSHALVQNRVGGCQYNCAVFTNLTQDHLDYHVTMDRYFDAKALLFKRLGDGDKAVINVDDSYAERFISVLDKNVKLYTYGIKKDADIKAENISFSPSGASFDCVTPVGKFEIKLSMNGMFSVYNVMAALTTAYAYGFDLETAIKALEPLKGVAGRFEIVVHHPLVIVDYAHTPDGLKNVLNAAREITSQDSKLVCVFGCGGDRDATKRPKMGAIAEELSDRVIVTSDNPRSEDPQQIITDILAGFKSVNDVVVEADRGKAIEYIKEVAQGNDVVVIAGKGHEDYQILADKTIHFDDREEARKVFAV